MAEVSLAKESILYSCDGNGALNMHHLRQRVVMGVLD